MIDQQSFEKLFIFPIFSPFELFSRSPPGAPFFDDDDDDDDGDDGDDDDDGDDGDGDDEDDDVEIQNKNVDEHKDHLRRSIVPR